VGFKSPEEELDQFLAERPSWMRKVLEWDFSLTKEEGSAFGEYGLERLADQQKKYEALASRVPAIWRKYRKRRRQFALASVPSAEPGRPRKDHLAEEARQLQAEGKSYAQIAIEINHRHGAGTTTPEAIRKLIGSRKPLRSGPDKI
jgi:hypothetical protein